MKSTIDAARHIVVPKALRQVATTPMKLKKRGKGVVAVPDAPLPPLTAEQVRNTLKRVRR